MLILCIILYSKNKQNKKHILKGGGTLNRTQKKLHLRHTNHISRAEIEITNIYNTFKSSPYPMSLFHLCKIPLSCEGRNVLHFFPVPTFRLASCLHLSDGQLYSLAPEPSLSTCMVKDEAAGSSTSQNSSPLVGTTRAAG